MNRIDSEPYEFSIRRALRDNVATNPGAATYNKGIINAYVTELNAYHKPDPDDSQRKYISEIVSKMKHTENDEERGSLKGNIKAVVEEILQDINRQRNNTFVIHNEYTKNVYGILAEHCTTNDRDNYIKSLANLYEIIYEVNQLADKPSFYHAKNPNVEGPYMTFIQTIDQFKRISGHPLPSS